MELIETSGDASVRVVSHRFRAKKPEPREEDTESPLPPPPTAPPDGKTRTLFMGVPLRSRKGRESLGAVQALINRLEAFGFPVHRYHSDRAKELRSRDLVAWLRSQGIHHTWTPGKTPAGNKAELAVQQIKSASRKLLAIVGLGHEWPFAVHHVSNRRKPWGCPLCIFFRLVSQCMRVVVSSTRISLVGRHALSLPGVYRGQAPDTPGGHLVWVTDPDIGPRVLLTNTVYPISTSKVPATRPTYRLRTKTVPEYVLNSVSAAPLLDSHQPTAFTSAVGSRFAPGGEWDVDVFEDAGFSQAGYGRLEGHGVGSDGEEGNDEVREEGEAALLEQRSPRQRVEGICKAARSTPESLKDLNLELLRRHVSSKKASFPECFEILQNWFEEGGERNGVFDGWECSLQISCEEGQDQRFPELRRFL